MDFLQQTNLMKAIFLKNKKNKEKTAPPPPQEKAKQKLAFIEDGK